MSNVTKKSEPLHLFRLSSELVDSFDPNDVEATFRDMAEMKISNPPYQNFAIQINSKFFAKLTNQLWTEGLDEIGNYNHFEYLFEYNFYNKGSSLRVEGLFYMIQNGKLYNILENAEKSKMSKEGIESAKEAFTRVMQYIAKLLVVVLATKNHVKEEKLDKDLLRGRYNKKQAYRKDYPITTTISIGKITESYKSSNGGGTVRPHMRRGHIRSQHYGPNNELMKKIFIQPVFVNADEGWIAERRAYNVKKEAA
jgi:hypothetical protein